MSLREDIEALFKYTRDDEDGDFIDINEVLTIIEKHEKSMIHVKMNENGTVEGTFPADTSTKVIVETLRPVVGHIARAQEKLDAMIDAPDTNKNRPAREDLLYLSGQKWSTDNVTDEVNAKGFAAIVEAIDALRERIKE